MLVNIGSNQRLKELEHICQQNHLLCLLNSTYFHLLSLYSNCNSSICGGIFHL